MAAAYRPRIGERTSCVCDHPALFGRLPPRVGAILAEASLRIEQERDFSIVGVAFRKAAIFHLDEQRFAPNHSRLQVVTACPQALRGTRTPPLYRLTTVNTVNTVNTVTTVVIVGCLNGSFEYARMSKDDKCAHVPEPQRGQRGCFHLARAQRKRCA